MKRIINKILVLLFSLTVSCLFINIILSISKVSADESGQISLIETKLNGDKNDGDPFIIKNGYVERNMVI